MRKIRTERARLGLLLALASPLMGVAFAARTARAEESTARVEARSHFARGVALAKQRAYGDALREFEQAYAIAPHFSVLYNIGQAQIALGQSAAAVTTLLRYLDEAGSSIDQDRRSEVETTVARERERLGEPHAGAATAAPGEPVPALVDLTPKAVAPAVPRPVATIRAANPNPSASRVSTLHPTSRSPTSTVFSQKLRQTHASATPHRTLAYVVGSAGAALAGGAFVHYLWNRDRYHEWQGMLASYQRDPTASNRQAANSLSESITRASAVTVVLALGAGLALGTGTVLFITASRPGDGHAGGASPFVTVKGTF